jgi:soluble lytic murein transglycosylase-like protein
MSEGSMFESIENVLIRIEEIKRRFGVRKTGWEQTPDSSFQQELAAKTGAVENDQQEQANASVEQDSRSLYGDIIQAASQRYRIPQSLIQAVIKQESGFDSSALSNKGAMGLMQLMPETARNLGVQDPYDAQENIFGGTRYLSDLISLYEGNLNRALAAYNAGPQRVRENIPEIRETKNFIESVIEFYDAFSKHTEGEVE